MNFPWSKPKPVIPVKVEVIRRESTKLTLAEWQLDKTLTNAAASWQNNDFYRLALQVLKNEHLGQVVYGPNMPLELRALHQARCEGYTMAIANLEAMATFKEIVQLPEPDFKPEESPNY